jgi:hypothetical protein
MAQLRKKRVIGTTVKAVVIVTKTALPYVISGGIVSDNGGTEGKVNVSACVYMDGHRVRETVAVADLAITTTHHVYIDPADNTVKTAASTPAGKLKLASGTHSGGQVTVTRDRLCLLNTSSALDLA